MPLNLIHSFIFRPELGWDPIPKDVADSYAERSSQIDLDLIDEVEKRSGGLSGKTLLDLGGGPGWYSVEFAKRGAIVTWHNISKQYENRVKDQAKKHGLSIDYSLGYLESIRHHKKYGKFDVVFNRVCFYYGMSDKYLAKVIANSLTQGGLGLIETHNDEWNSPEAQSLNWRQKKCRDIYIKLGIKIGHPHPPVGKIENILRSIPGFQIEAQKPKPGYDRFWIHKI